MSVKKRFYTYLASLAIILGAVLSFNFLGGISDASSLPRDCEATSIIYCGATTPQELLHKYNADKTGDLHNIYHHYGITDKMIYYSGKAQMGEVHRDGRITVNGKVVATKALSLGREPLYAGSTKTTIAGKTYYIHDPSRTFLSESIKAYVFTNSDGTFKVAILTSCGNPISATPTPKPKPKPQPKPCYSCDLLSQKKLSRDEYRFTTTAKASNGAKIASYTYNFGDGKSTTTASKTVDHTYAKPGKYTVKVSVNVTLPGGKKTVTSQHCQTTVTVVPPVVPKKPKPVPPVCKSISANRIDRTHYTFTGNAQLGRDTFVTSYNFTIRKNSANGAVVKTLSHHLQNKASYTTGTVTLQPGTYFVKLVVGSTVGEKTGSNCVTTFTVQKPQVVPAVCVQTTKTKIDRTHYRFTTTAKNSSTSKVSAYIFTVRKGSASGDVAHTVTIKSTKQSANSGSVALEPGSYYVQGSIKTDQGVITGPKCHVTLTIAPEMCTVPGKENLPANSPECQPMCTVAGHENVPANSSECKETPVVPTLLPHTGGMSGLISGSLGLGSLTVAGYYWAASRRDLLDKLLGR